MTTELPRDSVHLPALRLLCEFVCQPTDARRDAVMAVDWTALPRVDAALSQLRSPVTPSALSEVVRRIIQESVVDLEPRFPVRSDSITPLEVVRWHVLERQPWPSIEAMLREEGRPFSRGTLIRRQHEFIPYLLEWAVAGVEDSPDQVPPQVPPETPPGSAGAKNRNEHSRRFSPVRILALTLGVTILGIFLLPGLRNPDTSLLLDGADREFLGQSLSAEPGKDHPGRISLWRFLAPSDLPPIDGSYQQAAITEEDGRQYVYLGTDASGADHTAVIKWDPDERRVVWKRQLNPPVEERWTHDGVMDEPMGRVTYFVRWIASGVSPGRETRSIAAVLWSRYSPTFVYFLDRESGEEIGHYVHPGQLFAPVVIDLDGDGTGEYVLGGIDNARESAVLLILNESRGVSAASDVRWNQSGLEGARTRVLFPDVPELRKRMGDPHWNVVVADRAHFNSNAGSLACYVGAQGSNVSAYLVDADIVEGMVRQVRIRFAECHEELWGRIGMSLDQARAFIEPGIEILPRAYPVTLNRPAAHASRATK